MANAVIPQDAWDWPLLYYIGTVILNMSPPVFWKSTPRKLDALLKVHIELNNPKKAQEQSKVGYIDQII